MLTAGKQMQIKTTISLTWLKIAGIFVKREQARPKLKKLHDRSKNKDLDSLTVHQKQRVTFEKRNSGSLALIVIFLSLSQLAWWTQIKKCDLSLCDWQSERERWGTLQQLRDVSFPVVSENKGFKNENKQIHA